MALVATIVAAVVTAIATDAWGTARPRIVRLLFQRLVIFQRLAGRRNRRAGGDASTVDTARRQSLMAHPAGLAEPSNVSPALIEQAGTVLPATDQPRVPAEPVIHPDSGITIVNTGVIQGNVNINDPG